jgi:hypothetical protein
MFDTVMTIAGWLTFVGAVIAGLPSVAALRLKRLVPAKTALPASTAHRNDSVQPVVSVIVPARNESPQIGTALRSLLSAESIPIEIIAVNDRSEDDTGRIMEEVAREDGRVTVLHITELPEGWLGKNHAMHKAAQSARGRFLLFTDGDIHYQPGAISAALAWVEKHQLQHFCMLPKMIPGSLLENVLTNFFGMCFAMGMQLHLLRTRFPLSYAGVGAFNLVNADFYRRAGGHVPIRMDVLDDVKLGKLMKRSGGRSDFILADQWLSVRWQPSLWGVVVGLEKNAFASLNYSLPQILLVTVVFTFLFVLPVALPLLVPFGLIGLTQATGWLSLAVFWHLLFAWLVWPLPQSLLMVPFFLCGPFLMAFAYWRSAVITLRQGGVRWRNSFYSLQQLRENLYR